MPRSRRATSCDGLLGLLVEHVELRTVEAHLDGCARLRLDAGIDACDEGLSGGREMELELVPQEFDDVDLRIDGDVPVLAGDLTGVDVLGTDADDDVLADRTPGAGGDRGLEEAGIRDRRLTSAGQL